MSVEARINCWDSVRGVLVQAVGNVLILTYGEIEKLYSTYRLLNREVSKQEFRLVYGLLIGDSSEPTTPATILLCLRNFLGNLRSCLFQ